MKIELTTRVNLLQETLFNNPQGAVEEVRVTSSPTSFTRSYDKNTHKRCIRCRNVHPRERFGDHNSNDGKQSICFDCKNAAGKQRRDVNVRARLRHHMATRIISQLGACCPPNVTRDLEQYLGYTFPVLIRSLQERLARDYPGKRLVHALQEGWHVDHLYPLSRYAVLVSDGTSERVDWEAFKRCWDPSNLAAIPAEDNLKKGAKIINLADHREGEEYDIDEENPI